jgi:plastocyanin
MNKPYFTAVLLSLALGAGCGEYPGGAYVQPRVSFVAADSSASAADGAVGEEAAAESGTPGVFSGKVVLKGDQTALAPLITKGADVKDKEVCAAVDVPDERLVVGEGNGVANVFVYLAKAPKNGKKLEVPADPFFFDQKNCRFLPHCLIVPTGQTIKVLSDDSVAHNTHTYPNRNTGISSVVSAGDRVGQVEFVYSKAETAPFAVTCDFHGWMKAYHLPLDHPYYAVTDANGGFNIPELPAGKHTFVVWHEAADGNYVERKLVVEIQSGGTTELQIDYPVEKLKL